MLKLHYPINSDSITDPLPNSRNLFEFTRLWSLQKSGDALHLVRPPLRLDHSTAYPKTECLVGVFREISVLEFLLLICDQ